MDIMSVVGARPQFVKAGVVSRELARRGHVESMIHTGQHYDKNMSDVFFEEFSMKQPTVNLDVGSGNHGAQTAAMLIGIEEQLMRLRPDAVVLYGDTNSTLAGAVAASKLGVPVAHVEAGVRSYNRMMPEEHNRVLTDHCSDLLLCPSERAVRNLAAEGVTQGVVMVGDTMYDAVLHHLRRNEGASQILSSVGVEDSKYVLVTIHRPYNTDVPERLMAIFRGLDKSELPVVLPLHPRTRGKLEAHLGSEISVGDRIRIIDPVGYVDMLELQRRARVIVTDSGGIQKEAYFLGVRCVTVRPETEWPETVEAGWNQLVDAAADDIVAAIAHDDAPRERPELYGSGDAGIRCVDAIEAM